MKFQKAPAIRQIFPETTNDPLKERFTIKSGKTAWQIFPAKLKDGSEAVAFETHGMGFAGPVGLMIGINLKTDSIVGARVTTHSETPGVGARAKDDPTFVSQFASMSLDKKFSLKGEGGDIDGMSGATFTSKGVCIAARQAKVVFKKLKPEILKKIK